MASTSREGLKRTLVLTFVVISIILIVAIWAEGIAGNQQATPGYLRDTYKVDEDIYVTITAEAIEYQRQLTRTPNDGTPEIRHGSGQGLGQGQGSGSENH